MAQCRLKAIKFSLQSWNTFCLDCDKEKDMTLVSFLILLLVAGICGAIGKAIVGYGRGGWLVSIALGFIGALVGMWLAGALGLREMFAVNIGGQSFPILWSIMGAALFVAFISLFTRRWV
jgi:uncharacterized membrane protein YeaQ/YmgE (transglycosylase-associated protein family)